MKTTTTTTDYDFRTLAKQFCENAKTQVKGVKTILIMGKEETDPYGVYASIDTDVWPMEEREAVISRVRRLMHDAGFFVDMVWNYPDRCSLMGTQYKHMIDSNRRDSE